MYKKWKKKKREKKIKKINKLEFKRDLVYMCFFRI